jgi:hypothetical protein
VLAEALRRVARHLDAIVAQLLDHQRVFVLHRIAREGHAGAALVPLDDGEVLFPGLVDIVGPGRGRIARAAMDSTTMGLAQLLPLIRTHCSMPPMRTKPFSSTGLPAVVQTVSGSRPKAGACAWAEAG